MKEYKNKPITEWTEDDFQAFEADRREALAKEKAKRDAERAEREAERAKRIAEAEARKAEAEATETPAE